MPLILSSATEVHVQLGNGAPVFLPTAIGQHYIDVANKRLYQSVGIAKVEDWGSPLATTADLEAFDKTVTKGEVGLGNVENYGVASKPEAEAGLLNNLYMTPLRVTELMNALFMPTLTAFMGRADNPHDVTAAQVGALTVAETEALLALKMSEGDVAGLLDTFWASKIGSAPETMDTIEEIALALQNNPLVIEALQSLVGENKISIDAALLSIGTIQTALADHQGRIEVLEASVLTHQTDLAGKATKVELAAAVEAIGVEATRIDARVTTTNLEMDRVEAKVDTKVDIGGNVNTNTITVEEEEVTLVTLIAQLKAAIALAGDASALDALQQAFNAFVAAKASSAEVLEGLDNAKYTTSVGVKAAIDTAIAALVDGAPEALDTINELAAALQNNPDAITALQTLVSENSSALGLVADRVTAIEAELPNKVDQGGDITDNTVVVSDSAVALGELITQLQSAIAQAGDASALEALQQAFNAFVAAKATAEEAITGTDDEKYLTSVSAKAAIAAAVAELVGTAPEALDTINELAAALNNDPDTINTLMTQVGGKETPEGAQAKVDAALAIARAEIAALTTVVDTKVDKGGNIDTNTLTVGEGEEAAQVALSDVLAQLEAAFSGKMEDAATNLEALEAALDTFIAAKATGAEAIAGEDDAKYITALALKAALDALDLSGKLDVDAQAADSAKLEGLTLTEIITQIMGGEGSEGLTLTSLQDALDVLSGRVTATESDKLDATAQAVDSALLEGRSVADLTASGVEATSGVVTDKFMTPSTSKAALDAHWAEKVGTAPETLDTIEEIAAALRNAPDALDALESVAKEYTDTEVLAAIDLISGVDLVTGTTLASLYTSVQNLETTKLDVDAQAVDSAKLEGYTLSEVMDAAIQPGRLFYPVIHVNGSLDEDSYTMPTPADAWAQVQTNAVLEQVETVYAIAIKRLLPGNLLDALSAEGATLIGAVSTAQEGPDYVIMRAGIEDEVWTPVVEYKFACLARLARNCIIVGENTSRFVPGQTLFYNGFEGLSGSVYYDWSMLADKEWDTFVITDNNIVIDTANFHRSDIRIQATGPVSVTFDLDVDLPFQMDLRFVNQTGVDVTFVGANVFSAPRMEAYTMSKTNGVVVATIQTNAMVNLTGDLEEAFFINPDYVAG